jgi:ribose/xylose/arabinose/galactoside ABC-type transport system permease subunit
MRLVTLVLFILAWFLVPNFGTPLNVRAVLISVSAIGIAAVGLAFVTIAGRLFSLSIGATIAVSTVVFATYLHAGVLAAIGATLLAGLVIGAAQGYFVGLLKTNPIVTTIAAAAILIGVGQLITGGLNVTGTGDASVVQSRLFGWLPIPVALFFLTTAVAWAAHRYSRFGRRVTLVGLNERAALAGGVGSAWPVAAAFVLSALGAAVAGVIIGSEAGQGNLQLGVGLGLDVIVAVVVGGVSIKGGLGSPVDAAVGALFVGLVGNVLVLVGFSYENQLVLKGLLVLVAVILAGRSAQRAKRT